MTHEEAQGLKWHDAVVLKHPTEGELRGRMVGLVGKLVTVQIGDRKITATVDLVQKVVA